MEKGDTAFCKETFMFGKDTLNKQNGKKTACGGFTLVELLVVVAIVGVLVAISIPIFTMQLHKARVATDWANLRAYYSEIQADFIATGEYNAKVPIVEQTGNWMETEINFLDGQKVEMKDGYFAIRKISSGYQISYYCNKCLSDWETHSHTCMRVFGAQ